MWETISGLLPGVGQVLGGLSGLFGKKPKQPTPRDNMMSQAQGARDAAAEYGFNPLTMLQYGQPGGAMAGGGGGAPPLASIELLTSGLRDVNDIATGDAARRRQAEIMEMDLARIKLDQARSGVILPTTATDMGGSPAIFGRATPSIVPSGSFRQHAGQAVFNGGANGRSSDVSADRNAGRNSVPDGVASDLRPLAETSAIDPRRKVDNDPLKTHSGFITVDNPHAPWPVHIPTLDGDEGMQWYDLPSLGVYGAASGVYHLGRVFGEREARALGAGPVHTMEDGKRYQMYDPAKARQNREQKPPARRRHSLHSLGF